MTNQLKKKTSHNTTKIHIFFLAKGNIISCSSSVVSPTSEGRFPVIVGVAVGLRTCILERLGVTKVWTCLWCIMGTSAAVVIPVKCQACAFTCNDSAGSIYFHSIRTAWVKVVVATGLSAVVVAVVGIIMLTVCWFHCHFYVIAINQANVIEILVPSAIKTWFLRGWQAGYHQHHCT